MSIPTRVEDFVAIGERYLSEDIVNEADRLLPLATADINHLATRGYGQGELSKLHGFRAALVAEVAGRNQQRGSKKGSRSVEAHAIKEGKLVLRSGETTALAVLTSRTPHPGETPLETEKIVADTVGQIDALGGYIGTDSAKLRTRLTSLVSILGLPALAPAPSDAAGRAALVAKVEAAIAALPALAEQKKTDQVVAKAGTGSLDEIDGRAYTNLKTLAKVGRAYWREHGDLTRAGEYQLNALHSAAGKGGAVPPVVAPAAVKAPEPVAAKAGEPPAEEAGEKTGE
jgi:hypothetical protein